MYVSVVVVVEGTVVVVVPEPTTDEVADYPDHTQLLTVILVPQYTSHCPLFGALNPGG